MPNPIVTHYRDAKGVHHDIVVRKADDGAWGVLDMSVRDTKLIETLPGEGRAQAEAVARDYAAEQEASRETAAAEHA